MQMGYFEKDEPQINGDKKCFWHEWKPLRHYLFKGANWKTPNKRILAEGKRILPNHSTENFKTTCTRAKHTLHFLQN